jgi:hypothetical protein
MFMRVLLVLLCAFHCLCSLPDILPFYFQGEFVEFTAPLTNPPPYVNGIPQAPFYASRGKVYYDWTLEAMIEERLDYCVNIFPDGNDFSCVFFNIQGATYLLSNDTTDTHPPCCLFGKPWHPPSPTFLRDDKTAKLVSRIPWDDKPASWWILPSIETPTGPFWFAFRNESIDPQVYLSFSFPGVQGWVVQNFFNISYTKPDPSVWILPEICMIPDLPNCGFLPL